MIMQEIVQELEKIKALRGLNLKKILLTRHFAAVELTNSAVGTAMNYATPYNEVNKNQKELEKKYLTLSKEDPLLYKKILTKKTKDLNEQALRVAILAAVSYPFINEKYLQSKGYDLYEYSCKKHENGAQKNEISSRINSFIKEGDIATVIGFGGFMMRLAQTPSIKKVYVTDMNYGKRYNEIKQKIKEMNKKAGYKKVIFKPANKNKEVISKSGIVSITASSMCNGTIDALLRWSKNCRVIFVQGISGGVLPYTFFKHGASVVFLETKDKKFIRAYEKNEKKYYWFTEYSDRKVIFPKTKN